MKILAVFGATQTDSLSAAIVQVIADSARAAGADVTQVNLLELSLPPMRIDQDYSQLENVQTIRHLTSEADAFIVVSPEYHGSMSNWIKNYFDFHYQEFAGKLFALAASTGGSMGSSCLANLRTTVQYCHGWTLPYQTAVKESEFDKQTGKIAATKSIDRLQRMGRDLCVYGRLLRHEFLEEQQKPIQESTGFAAWYIRKD